MRDRVHNEKEITIHNARQIRWVPTCPLSMVHWFVITRNCWECFKVGGVLLGYAIIAHVSLGGCVEYDNFTCVRYVSRQAYPFGSP